MNIEQLPYDSRAILDANLLLVRHIHSGIPLDQTEIDNTFTLLLGISQPEIRKSSITSFLQNVSLLFIKHKDYTNAFNQLQNALKYDVTTKSIRMICFLTLLDEKNPMPFQNEYVNAWKYHITRKHEIVLKTIPSIKENVSCYYLLACAYLYQHKYDLAITSFKQSLSLSYRILDSLIGCGICSYYLRAPKDSLNYFERAIRSSGGSSKIALFNLAELCGTLGSFEQQMILLKFYARLEETTNDGSLNTLYKLGKISMMNNDYNDAVEKFYQVNNECVQRGLDPPSSSFYLEYAYSSNILGDYKTAMEMLPVNLAHKMGDIGIEVAAHSLFLSANYKKCYEFIYNLTTAESKANQGVLAFVAGDDRKAMSLLNSARSFIESAEITRNLALIHLSRSQNLKSGCMIWMTKCGYSINHDAQFYSQLYLSLKQNGLTDKLTLCVIDNWRKIKEMGN